MKSRLFGAWIEFKSKASNQARGFACESSEPPPPVGLCSLHASRACLGGIRRGSGGVLTSWIVIERCHARKGPAVRDGAGRGSAGLVSVLDRA